MLATFSKKKLRPHKTEYWLYPKIACWKAFKKRVELICMVILWHLSETRVNHHLFSIDEKTGIQALERKEIMASGSGKIRRLEFEYKRHGTTCLIGALNVSNGKLEACQIGPTRKEKDFLNFIKKLCKNIPLTDRITIILDQLNTHKSESLVRWVAQMINYKGELGTKEYKGILKSQNSRMAFLENPDHRIHLIFTPIHCSWLNPIENWFSKLQRQRLRNANFKSLQDLDIALSKYIKFANVWFAKPYKWKFKGFVKNYQLRGIKLRA